jgi:hypothetical protein
MTGNGGTQFYYRIEAFNSSNQSLGYTNIVSTCGQLDWSNALFLVNSSGIPLTILNNH